MTINLRANHRQRALIDRAAQALGKTRSDFVLEAACREAGAVLADRRFLLLDEKTYRRLRRPSTSRRLRTPACAACWRRERHGSDEPRMPRRL